MTMMRAGGAIVAGLISFKLDGDSVLEDDGIGEYALGPVGVCTETTYEELLRVVAEDAVKSNALLPETFTIVPEDAPLDAAAPALSDTISAHERFVIRPVFETDADEE